MNNTAALTLFGGAIGFAYTSAKLVGSGHWAAATFFGLGSIIIAINAATVAIRYAIINQKK